MRTMKDVCLIAILVTTVLLVGPAEAQDPVLEDLVEFEQRVMAAIEPQRQGVRTLSAERLPTADEIGPDWRAPWQLPAGWRDAVADEEAYWQAFFAQRFVDAGMGRGIVEQVLNVPGLVATDVGPELVRMMASPAARDAMSAESGGRTSDDLLRDIAGILRTLYAPMSELTLTTGSQEYAAYKQLLEQAGREVDEPNDDAFRLIERSLAAPFADLAEAALEQRVLDMLAMIEGVGAMDFYRAPAFSPDAGAAGGSWSVAGRGVVLAIDPAHGSLLPAYTDAAWARQRRELETVARETYGLLLELTEIQTRAMADRRIAELARAGGERQAEETRAIEAQLAEAEAAIARTREELLERPLGLTRCRHGQDCHVVLRLGKQRDRNGELPRLLYGWFRTERFIARAVVSGAAPEEHLTASMDQLLAAIHARLEDEPATVKAFDANPLFTGVAEIAALTAEDIADLEVEREGAIADGASRLVLRWAVDEPGTLHCALREPEDGRCRVLGVLEHDGSHYATALYRPPDSFGPMERLLPRFGGEVEARAVPVTLRFEPEPRANETAAAAAARSRSVQRDLVLARPPVVLVHGTYDWPEKAWQQGLEGGPSLDQRLRNAGFRTFLVDYRWSNGSSSSQETGVNPLDRVVPDQGRSSFAANRLVVWSDRGHHPGDADSGIERALVHFRETLALAATRADVVGHSMGGVLPRVYASASYTGERYRRPENFMQGDIHRLITLCSTHFGSDVMRALAIFERLFPDDFGSGTEYLLARSIPFLADLVAGLKTGASRDQLPESEALRRIGPTEVAAHAIGCVASPADLDAYGGDTGNLYLGMTYLFYAFPRVAEEALKAMGQAADARRLVGISEGIDWNAALNDMTKLGVIEIWPLVSGAMRFGGIGTDPEAVTDKKVIRALGRAALFGNARNDGVVRLQSQWGGLREAHRTTLLGVDHSDAPRLRHVQNQIIGLLRGPAEAFAEQGFPRAGQPLLSRVPGEQPVAAKLAAIEASNIVYTHALAISEVAQQRGEVIIIRPVNSHSTRLIEADSATKEMRVKGKSADWGPQRGLIAVDQAFSKITGPADTGAPERIAKFNCEVLFSIQEGIAVPRDYRVRIEGAAFDVHRRRDASSGSYQDYACNEANGSLAPAAGFAAAIGERIQAGRRPPLYLRDAQGRFWHADDPDLPARDVVDAETIPLRVLADPKDGRYLTADYDLLAIGTRGEPGEARFDPARGYVTESYLATIRAINQRVEATGYDGGNVVHHGPESHFTKSEGVDYPNTVFAPNGEIEIIRQGPEGQADRYAKRLFARFKRAGWHLEPNQRWNWGEFDEATGLWRDEDLPNGDPGPGHPEPILLPDGSASRPRRRPACRKALPGPAKGSRGRVGHVARALVRHSPSLVSRPVIPGGSWRTGVAARCSAHPAADRGVGLLERLADDIDQRRPVMGDRLLQNTFERLGVLDPPGPHAEGGGDGGMVGRVEVDIVVAAPLAGPLARLDPTEAGDHRNRWGGRPSTASMCQGGGVE